MLYQCYHYRYMSYLALYLFKKPSFGIAQRGNKILIKLCKFISFIVNKDISIYFFIALTYTLNKVISIKYLL